MESRVIVSNGSVRQVLADIYEDINWAYLAKTISANHVVGFIISSVV